MKIIIYQIFTLTFLILCFPNETKAQKVDERYILNYWVFSSLESKKPVETYRLKDYNFDPTLSHIYLNAGTEFYKNQTVKRFRAKLCGNDYDPNFVEGKWEISKKNEATMLQIRFQKEVNLFEIIELTKDKLVLKRL